MVLQDLENVISYLKDAETGQRGYLLTGDVAFLEDYKGARENVMGLVASIQEQTKDNPSQLSNSITLKALAESRLNDLQQYIDLKRGGQPIEVIELKEGKAIMDQVRALINKMEETENNLLTIRNASVESSSKFTPLLIILAFIVAMLITIYFYIKLKNDYEERKKLQQELERTDDETRNRIEIIQNVAEKISDGDYKIRIENEDKDGLGSLALALNKMAQSLELSFGNLAKNEWLQKGIAGVNDAMVGEKNLQTLIEDTLAYIVEFTESQVGAFYLLDRSDTLRLAGGYALNHDPKREKIKIGEGLTGQAAASKKEIVVADIPAQNISITHASGEIKPTNLAVFPIIYERKLKGVIEIASVDKYTEQDLNFVKEVCPNIGIAIQSAQNHQRLQELLEETQTQSEELQAQHSELENMNAELEAQTQKLQTSEEELKVQQQELMQANQDLEERTRTLEEKNQIIVERNLEIQKKAEELAISTKYKSEFLANMSHELRTPLNSILLLSRLLSDNNDKNLSKDQIEYAQVIQSAGNGLLNLIDEILDLSKIEAGKMNLEFEEVKLQEIVEDMRNLFLPLAKEKSLALNISLTDTPDTIYTDKMRLEQILKNLFSNALKFTAKGHVNLEIFEAKKPGFISFSVIDSGLGIPEEKQKLIFEAFQQADGSTRRKFGGTGLGLSISRELARLLGGEISLESIAGEGSTFTITVPATKIEKQLPAETFTEEKMPEIVAENTGQERPSYLSPIIPEEVADDRSIISEKDKVILIVEDDTNFATSILSFTRKSGYKGIVVVRGDQALEMALHYKPSAILLDIVLPVKDGWQVMEELKSNPATRHIPVHMMSSMEAKRESIVKGAIDFINKPVALDQMQQIFSKLEEAFNREKRKVVIIEENTKHAQALSYFLENFNVTSEIAENVKDGADFLKKEETDCIILDMGLPDQNAYEILEMVKKNPDMEDLPIIIFTGKSLSKAEETRIKQYADSIVVKTAHSYQRILDEVGLFLHLVEEQKQQEQKKNKNGRLGSFNEVLKGRKVLVADDDVRNIFSITKALERHKMEVISAIDGKEALQQLEAHPDVNVVLMDMMMPELDGYETTTRIRQDPRFKYLPILAVTAKAMMGDREKCIRAGASDYISKPVDIDQLTSLLRVWLYDQK